MAELALTSSAFAIGGRIPRRGACEGEALSPPLAWQGTPPGTRSFALIVDDPDAPGGAFTHWVAWGIAAEAGGLAEGETPPGEGRNDFGTVGYRGPCPPPGHGPHHYFFRLYALDSDPALTAGARRPELAQALEGHVLASAELVGLYER